MMKLTLTILLILSIAVYAKYTHHHKSRRMHSKHHRMLTERNNV